jgi:chorismate mutase
LPVRGIRGATTVERDAAQEIIDATRELLQELIEANRVDPAEVAGVWFTTTRDLTAEFPAIAARQLGWVDVPLLCGHEMDVSDTNPRSIPRCIRVLIQVNTEAPQSDMKFIYLRRAKEIKADLDNLRGIVGGAEG